MIRGAGGGRGSLVTLVRCSLSALLEGYDNQSAGVAAPRLVPEFDLSSSQSAIVFSAASLGLFVGAAIGGRLSDHLGRRRTLALSLLAFGLFSLLTTISGSYEMLVATRFLTGFGLGGAMPNFIALASRAAPERRRVGVVAMVTAGMPLGGAVAAPASLSERFGWGWRAIFYLGGGAPLVIALLVWWLMPDDRQRAGAAARSTGVAAAPVAPMPAARIDGVARVLFGEGRLATTLCLWGGYFFTQLILLLMLNWLPTLMIALHYTRPQASMASMCFNLAGAAGAIGLGHLHAHRLRWQWVLVSYLGMASALFLLPRADGAFALAALASAGAGLFIIGAQLILFAAAPLYYRTKVHGTGVGFAVAVGRLGSVVGPLFAGALLAAGSGGAGVLLAILPFVAVGGTSTLALATRPIASEPERPRAA